MRSADLLVKTLQVLEIKYIFSLSGNQIMPIYDALIGSGIQIIHTRHEAAAVHMADAWGRLTGQPGIALIAAGPGFANSLSATFVAKMAESPVVVLSGQASNATKGKGDFQELPQAEMAAAVSKASWTWETPNQIGNEFEKAFATAKQGRPGPVHLALPADLLSIEVNPNEIKPTVIDDPLKPISSKNIDQLIDAIQLTERPLFLAGPAVIRSDAFSHAQEACSKAGLPLIDMKSPRGVIDPALGTISATLKRADLLILFGKKLDFTLKFGQEPFIKKGTKIIQIDADSAVLDQTKHNGINLNLLELIHGNPTEALELLATALNSHSFDKHSWTAEVAQSIVFTPPEWDELVSEQGKPMFSAEVAKTIDEYLAGAENSVMISDGGEFGQWIQALVRPPNRVINGLAGSIGNAIPFAVAARLAFPESRIVACTGDGAVGFLPFEYDTAVRYKLPFVSVIGNDARWNAEYQIQLRNYGPDRIDSIDLHDTNYHEIVSVLGGWGQRVTDVDALKQSLVEAGESNLPACINASIKGEAAPNLG